MDCNAFVKSFECGEKSLAVSVTVGYNDRENDFEALILRRDAESLGISAGRPLTDDDIDDIRRADSVRDAFFRGMRLLSYGDNTKRKLEYKLKSRGIAADVAADAVSYLSDGGYIDERKQLEARASVLVRRLYGKRKIVSDLLANGFSRDDVSAWGSSCDIDFSDVCRREIEKHGGLPPAGDSDAKRRLLSHLARRGFSSDDVRCAVRMIRDGET